MRHKSRKNSPESTTLALAGQLEHGSMTAQHSFALANIENIERLLRHYMDEIYPVLPLFHGPTLRERIQNQDYLYDCGFFASVMAACALVSARAQEGPLEEGSDFREDGTGHKPEVFYSAASESIPRDLSKAGDLSFLRACGLLCMTAFHTGEVAQVHLHLGVFCTLPAMHRFHDELHWPKSISLIDTEERRRLYWSMYRLDVLAGYVFDSAGKFEADSANVKYPTECNDAHIKATCYTGNADSSWIQGWNFQTDLYRVLERIAKSERRSRCNTINTRDGNISMVHSLVHERLESCRTAGYLVDLYRQLPANLRNHTASSHGATAEDLYSFQAAHTHLSLQLVRITLVVSDSALGFQQKWGIAEELLSSLNSISRHALQATGALIAYSLTEVAKTMARSVENIFTEDSYLHTRYFVVFIANAIKTFRLSSGSQASLSEELHSQTERLDRLASSRKWPLSGQVHSTVDPRSMVEMNEGSAFHPQLTQEFSNHLPTPAIMSCAESDNAPNMFL